MCYGTVTALIFAPILLQFSLTLILGRGRQECIKCFISENCLKERKAQVLFYFILFFFSGLARDQNIRETDHKTPTPAQGSTGQ